MKYARFAIAFGLGLGAGVLCLPHAADTPSSPVRKETAIGQPSHANAEITPPQSAIRKTAAVDIPAPPSLAKRGLSEEEKRARLRAIFPGGKLGQALARATLLFPYATTGLAQDRELDAILRKLKKSPEESIAAIQDGLSRFAPELETERMYWVQIASRLDAVPAEKVELLRAELARPFDALGSNVHLGNPAENAAITVDCLLDVTHDSKEVESAVVPAVQRFSGDKQAMGLLLTRVATRFPDLSRDLAKRFASAK